MVHCLFHVIVNFLSQILNFCYHNNAPVWQIYFTVLVEWSDPQIPAVCRFVICDIFSNVTICRVVAAATLPVVVISIAKPTSFAFLLLYSFFWYDRSPVPTSLIHTARLHGHVYQRDRHVIYPGSSDGRRGIRSSLLHKPRFRRDCSITVPHCI